MEPSKDDRRNLRRAERRERQRLRKEEKRAEEAVNASKLRGAFEIGVALVLLGFMLLNPHLWWLVFVALGIGTEGARQYVMASKREADAKPALEAQSTPARHEIDALCDQLLSDLEASPDVVKSFLQDPEKTVESLRQTAKTIDERRASLIASNPQAQLEALKTRRTELNARREASNDPLARSKFDTALRSLDGEEAAVGMLKAMTERLDGEYTSLLSLLQELKTRVAVARSTGSGPQLADVQQSVQRLNAELEAITDSLQLAPIDAEPMEGSGIDVRSPGSTTSSR